ncbi:MAG: phasin, partial [Hyphomicrobiales bacterium]|nr:phasin [Hyphomicrobiales bacterium]
PAASAPAAAAVLPAPTEVLDLAMEQMGAVREVLRQTGESTLESSRVAYDRLKKAAEESTGSLEEAYSVAQKGLAELNAKALEALKANADASFEFARALSGARSLSDVLSLQGEHARKGFEALAAQTKEIASLAQKVASETAGPISGKLAKTFDAAA